MSRVVLACALVCALAACARAPGSRGTGRSLDGAVPIDNEVMAYLSMARARHHEANLEEDRDVPAAVRTLQALVAAPRPHPGTRVPEVEEVLADSLARIAELDLREPDLEAAAVAVREGLTHATEPSYFRGHLLEVGGIVEEARVATLRDAGADASLARRKAIDLLREAVDVQEAVVRASLHGDAGAAKGHP